MTGARPQLVPAIEADTVEHLLRDVGRVASLAPLLHYDVADGDFVTSRTPRPADYPKVPEGVRIFWHLMVQSPAAWLDECLAFDTAFVAVAAEARGATDAIEELTKRGVKAVLSLNPETRPRDVAQLIDTVSIVQIMTIEPGGQGRPLEPTLLTKLGEVRAINPSVQLAVDGGINAATIEAVVRYQPDYIAIGSALTRAESAADAWQTLNRLVESTLSKG